MKEGIVKWFNDSKGYVSSKKMKAEMCSFISAVSSETVSDPCRKARECSSTRKWGRKDLRRKA